MKIELRASFGWPVHPDVAKAACRNGTVVHYDSNNQGLAGRPHEACRDYWKWCRRFHMNDKNHLWSDIGYSFAVCPHGIVMEGRGFGYSQAAQPGGNTTWTSVTFMSGKTEPPTEKQVIAYRELRSWLRSEHDMTAGERPHKDFTSTDCPGPILSEMVADGTLRGKTPAPKPTSPDPAYAAPPFPLPSGHWFGVASKDPKNHSGYWAKDRPYITAIQRRFRARGWTSVSITGLWYADLTGTVRKFQAEKGLKITGRVDKTTWKALWEAKIT